VAVTEELVERIDEYLNYVVEEWMQENRLAVEQGLRTEITENFIGNLRGLFAESYIEVPEEKLDLFESTVEEVETLDGELKSQVEKNMELVEEVEQLKCEIVFRQISEGLTDTEVEKLRRLAEDLDFDTVEQFAEKISVLRENIENIGTVANETATEDSLEESFEEASEASPLVEAVVRSMSKSRQ
jgi:DNA-binding protein H-NS